MLTDYEGSIQLSSFFGIMEYKVGEYMSNKIKKLIKSDYTRVFLLSLLVALIMLLPSIIKNKGLLILSGDFQTQQVAFNVNVNDQIRSGNTLYTFNNDLGSSIIEGYSFYDLGSPFFLLGLIFPSSWFPYLIGIFLILKYAFTGLFSYIYFIQFVKRKELAVLGSLLYTFSGFQICNMLFYHFHDIVMLFPLLLYSIDKLFQKNKKGLFAIILGLTILTNYVFAFGELVFLFIYLVINGICGRFKYSKKNILMFIFELFIAIGLSMCILLPSIISLSSNPRVGNSLSLQQYFLYPFTQYIKIFQALLIPTDIINKSSVVNSANWASCEMWIPFFGILLPCVYVLKNKKNYLSVITITLSIFMLIPILNSSFTVFNAQYYARWYYIQSIFIVIMSIKTLDDRIELKNGINLFKIIWEIYILLLVVYFIYIIKGFDTINTYYLINILIAFFCFILVPYIVKKYYKYDEINLLIIPVIICILMEGYHYINYQSIQDINYDNNKLYVEAINTDLIKDNEFYRVKYLGCMYNMNLYFNESSIDSFNSSIAPSIFKIYNSLGIYRKQNTSISLEYRELIDFYSTKYIVTCNSRDLKDDGYKYLYKKEKYTVYLNEQYQAMGIILNDVISNEQFSKIKTSSEKIKIFSDSFIANEKDDIIDNSAEILDSFTRKVANGVYSNIEVSADSTILYTIPYDNNFIITVNDKKVDYFELNNGLIGFNIPKGSNEISIIYKATNFKNGLVISLGSLILLIIYSRFSKKYLKN